MSKIGDQDSINLNNFQAPPPPPPLFVVTFYTVCSTQMKDVLPNVT